GRTTVSNASQRTTATIATPRNPEVARTLQPPVEKTADRPARADVAFAVYARSPRRSFFARDDHRTDHNGGAHPVLVRIRLESVCTRRQRRARARCGPRWRPAMWRSWGRSIRRSMTWHARSGRPRYNWTS